VPLITWNSPEEQGHYVLFDAVSGEYIGEFVPVDGTGAELAAGIFGLFLKKGMDINELRIVGGDSTGANTGKFIGAMACLERLINRSLNRFICTLHLNELLLRPLVRFYVGETSGPDALKGELGQKIKSLKNPKITTFPAIPNPSFPVMEKEVLADLSQDQKLLYLGSQAVMSGYCSPELASRTIGPFNNSRWTTLGIFHDQANNLK
jgi:hypothetical protein